MLILLWELGQCDITCKQRHKINRYGKLSITTLFYFYILGRVCKIPVKNSCRVTDDGQLTNCDSHTYVKHQQVCPFFFNCTNINPIELTQRTINMTTSTRAIPSDDDKPLPTIQYINTKPILTTASKPSSTINTNRPTTTILKETTNSTSTIYLIVIVIMLVCLIVLIIIIVCKIKRGGNSSLINQAFEMSSF